MTINDIIMMEIRYCKDIFPMYYIMQFECKWSFTSHIGDTVIVLLYGHLLGSCTWLYGSVYSVHRSAWALCCISVCLTFPMEAYGGVFFFTWIPYKFGRKKSWHAPCTEVFSARRISCPAQYLNTQGVRWSLYGSALRPYGSVLKELRRHHASVHEP